MIKKFEILSENRKVDRETDKPFDSEPEEKAGLDLEFKKYQEEGQKFIDSYKRFFMTFAKDISLSFKMSDGFYIDLEKGEVNSDTKWFAERKLSKIKILWAHLHEIIHFRDLVKDPKGIMGNFEYIRERAKETGALILQKWEAKYGTSDPEFIERLKKQKPVSEKHPERTMNAVEMAAYKIHHRFYNIFDDIYDNNEISKKASLFEASADGGKEVEQLYSETLFPKTDYLKSPRHFQFTDKLIREDMVKGEEVAVSEEVAEIFRGKLKFMGREWTPQEIIENFIKPRRNRETKASQRHYVLRQTLEPIFKKLVLQDIKEWDPQKPEPKKQEKGEPQEGGESGNPFDADYQDYDKNNPDQISPEEIENWMKKNEEDKKSEKEKKDEKQASENKTAEEKAGEAQDKMDADWCAKNSVKPETLKQYRKIENEVAPYLEELSRLWQKIIFGSTRKIERGMGGYFKIGAELDVQKTIEKWPEIQRGNFEEAQIFKKMTQKEVLIKKPELIRVRLIGDMSGSMDSRKIHILQQCFVLLLSSLQEFNSYLNFERTRTKSKLEVDTEAWIFGDDTEQIKELRKGSNYTNEQIAIIKIFEKLQNTIGRTYDNKVLEKIFSSLSSDDKAKIDQGKMMEIVLEVTDGGSSDVSGARSGVDNLSEAGVVTRAFQIGSVSEDEKKKFNQVWNNNRKESFGEIVGENIANLLPAVTEVLKKYLSNVKL